MNQQKTEHPYLRDGWAMRMPEAMPDVNPADEAVARLRRRMVGGSGSVFNGDGPPPKDGKDGEQGEAGSAGGGGGAWAAATAAAAADAYTLAQTANAAATTANTKIAGASISAGCNGDGTITVTLTWGS